MYRKTVYTIAHTFSLCFERLTKYRIKLVKFTDSSNMQCAHPQKQEEAKCWHLSGRLPAALQKKYTLLFFPPSSHICAGQ